MIFVDFFYIFYMVEVVPVPSQARRACRAYTSKDSVVLGLDSSHGTDS